MIETTLLRGTSASTASDPATTAANAFYQQVFGRDALAQEVATFRAAMDAGVAVQQIDDDLLPQFVHSEFEDGLLKSTYKQVTGVDIDDDTLVEAKAELRNGAWLDDIRYGFSHSDAGAAAVDETFHDVLGRSASDDEVAIWEDELSDTGTTAT